jgi:hypothetical protein
MAIESNLHTQTPLETRETHSLIGSDKVEGTAVYRSNGDKVGNIARVMIGQAERQSRLRRHELRRLHGHWRRLLPAALVAPDLQSTPGRIRGQYFG